MKCVICHFDVKFKPHFCFLDKVLDKFFDKVFDKVFEPFCPTFGIPLPSATEVLLGFSLSLLSPSLAELVLADAA